MNNLRQLLCLGILLSITVSRLRADAPDQPPKGLNQSEWSSLRAAYDAGRHRIATTASGLQARNPGQQWKTRFDGQGFLVQPDGADWQWGLELTAYGFPGHEHTLPTGRATTLADVSGSRLDYAWDAGLTEWFVNDARGLEHGFTVHERPRGRVEGVALKFHLAIRGDLRPVLEPDGRGVRFVDAHGTTRTTYAGLKMWDADGKILPAHFDPPDTGHPDEVTFTVEERGARYPLTIDPIAQQAYLKASNTAEVAQFGFSVAVSGDTVVVGADHEGADLSGAAYVFVRHDGVWAQQAYLKASNAGPGFSFGWSVAVFGDTVIVGSPHDSASAVSAGAAYVFVRSGTNWTEQAYLKASSPGEWDGFGWSVSVSGDTVVVGAPSEDSNASGVNGDQSNNSAYEAGSAYVFVRRGTAWTQQAYLKASNPESTDFFGTAVSVSDDTVVVGAPFEDSGAIGVNGNPTDNSAGQSGAAYVFMRRDGVWMQQASLKASNTGLGDQFGTSVAVSGDTAIVGAPWESSNARSVNGSQADNSASQSGAAYVFVRSGTTWAQQAYLKASNAEAFDRFGTSVAVSDGKAVVGAFGEDSRAVGVNGNQADNLSDRAGAAYLFGRRGTTWAQQAYLKASNTEATDFFGNAVAISGGTLAVGAQYEDSKATGVNGDQADNSARISGAAYVYYFSEPKIRVEHPAGVALFDASSNVRLGAVSVGSSTDLVFTVRNSGTTNLTDLAPTLTGPDGNQFQVTVNPATSLVPDENTTFTVRFSPTSEGTKTATLHIASNDPNLNPFDVTLVGTPNVPTVAASGNDLTVSFVGNPGSRYRVQYLPELSGPWTEFTPPAFYTAPANGVFSHTDLNSPDTLRLYRAVLAP